MYGAMEDVPFWKRKTLEQMTHAEWESLCDGCGKCCLEKLQDEETGEIAYTNVACRLLDTETCRCSNYSRRMSYVFECVKLTPRNITELSWIPRTCAYRLLAEGKDLFWWHPLVSGNPETVHQAGMSVRGRSVPVQIVDDIEDHVVDWAD